MTERQPTSSAPAGGDSPNSDEFDAAFDEYSEADAQPSDEDRPGEAAGDDAARQTEAEPDGSGQDAPATDAEPAPDAGSGQQQHQTGQGQQPSAEDIWANATQEQRAAYQAAQDQLRQLDHADRSNRGRISALQRQIDQLSRQMTDDHAETGKSSGGGQQKRGQSQAATPDAFETEDWQKLKEEYPEVLGPVEQALRSRDEQLQQVNKRLEQFGEKFQGLDQAQHEAYLAGQEQALSERHPDWQQVTASDQFLRWYESAPKKVREAVENNADGIVDADDAAFALDLFKQSGGGQAQNNQQQPSGQQTGGQDRTRSRRQRQLNSAQSVQGKGPGAASGAPDEFEAAFEHYAQKS